MGEGIQPGRRHQGYHPLGLFVPTALIWGPLSLWSWSRLQMLFHLFFLQKFPYSVLRASFTLFLTSSTCQTLLAGFSAVYFWLASNIYGYFLFPPQFLNILLGHKHHNRL